MRISEKLDLIDKIGRELQRRFTYDEINAFLAEFQVKPPDGVISNSKWVYSKAALSGVSEDTVLKIAAELEMPVSGTSGSLISPPRNWQGTSDFRLFISHISKEKQKATRLKECSAPFGIAAFVAHEDIHPTLEWQSEIEKALHTMDALVAMHTPGFSQSYWTQQEIGFAVGKGVKIISLRMGEDPTGFISKHQALPRGSKTAEAIANDVVGLLAEDRRTKDRLEEAQRARADEIPF
jgi:hypothetical protein